MAEKDIVEKLLEEYNDVFADIVNGLLFRGKEVVLPDQLCEISGKARYKAGEQIHELERDVAKLWKSEKMRIALCGMENQTKSERDMPLRVIGYDGGSYRAQLLNKTVKERYPVLTLILYFGMEHWNQPKNLKKLMKIPKELEPYINDYKISVFEIAWLNEEQVNMFKSDFRIVADYFVQMRKNSTYEPSRQQIRHVDAVMKLLSVFGEDERFRLINTNIGTEKGVNTMCEWLDKVEEKSRQEGIEQGIGALIETCMEFGITREATVVRCMEKLKLTRKKAEEYVEKSYR